MIDLDGLVEKYMKPALVFEPEAAETSSQPASIFGAVTHCAPGEPWPRTEGVALCPLLQLNFEDTPFRPRGGEDIRFLTLFVHPTQYPDGEPNGTTWCLRTYQKTSHLVALEPPNLEWPVQTIPLSNPVLVEDYPCFDDLEETVPDAIWQEFSRAHQTVAGIKWGGWPRLIQSEIFWAPMQKHPAQPRFVLQVDSCPAAGWQWGNDGCAYFGRGTTAKHKDSWAVDWQCF